MDHHSLEQVVRDLHDRAFCYDVPAEFRAGVDALADRIRTLIAEELPEFSRTA